MVSAYAKFECCDVLLYVELGNIEEIVAEFILPAVGANSQLKLPTKLCSYNINITQYVSGYSTSLNPGLMISQTSCPDISRRDVWSI